ncbi:MAG: hypothetical protein ABIL01_02190 [Pseudomonadota bacterium]
MEIDDALVLRTRYRVGRHDRQVDIGAVPLGMGPDPPGLVIRIFAISPDRPDDPPHRFQRALAANAVDDEDCGSLASHVLIEACHVGNPVLLKYA